MNEPTPKQCERGDCTKPVVNRNVSGFYCEECAVAMLAGYRAGRPGRLSERTRWILWDEEHKRFERR